MPEMYDEPEMNLRQILCPEGLWWTVYAPDNEDDPPWVFAVVAFAALADKEDHGDAVLRPMDTINDPFGSITDESCSNYVTCFRQDDQDYKERAKEELHIWREKKKAEKLKKTRKMA